MALSSPPSVPIAGAMAALLAAMPVLKVEDPFLGAMALRGSQGHAASHKFQP